MTDPTTCKICALEDADESARVFRDDLFAAESVKGSDIPGWYFLRVRRHAELITGLDAQEVAAFGQRYQDLVAAVQQATAAPAVYFMTFGENYRHFHGMVCARAEDVPKEKRGGLSVTRMPEDCDTEASLALVPKVRAAYEAIVAAREAGSPHKAEA